VTYYLDPIEKVIQPWIEIGSGIPRAAYNNIWVKILTAPANAIPESVVNTLLRLEDQLVYDCEVNFRGTEWDGDYIGIWRSKPNYPFEYELEVACFWQPEDWFELDDLEDLKNKWKRGMTPTQIIESKDLGDYDRGMVDKDEALEWLEQMIEEWKKEEEGEEEE
jgi:hypothetical protein